MEKKRVLLVDDEPGILATLKKSLQKLEQTYDIETALDGNAALSMLQNQHFDLVVTDYKMAGLDGIKLLERINRLQPGTRVILMTAYGNDQLEAQARRLRAYEYLTKPLEIGSFRQVVQHALNDLAVNQPGLLVLSDERYREVDHLLQSLERDVGALCVLLVNAAGQTILQRGNIQQLPIEELVSLLSGGIATLSEAGQVLEHHESAINLVYREGRNYDVYGLNIEQELLLILLINRGEYSSPLGSVWYYARRVAHQLVEILGSENYATAGQIFEQDFDQMLGDELDDLLGLDAENTTSDEVASVGLAKPDPDETDGVFTLTGDHRAVTDSPPNPAPDSPPDSPPLVSFQDAIKRGILPPEILLEGNEPVDQEESHVSE